MRGTQHQGLDAGGALRNLARPAKQVEAHRDDVAALRAALQDPDARDVVGGGQRVCHAAGRRVPRTPGTGEHQRNQREEARGARSAGEVHGPLRAAGWRSQAASRSVVSGGASTPITRGRPTTYVPANRRRSSMVWAAMRPS